MNKGSLSAVLDELVIYRGILKDDVINILKELFNELSFRITSYNVCYTKLLRLKFIKFKRGKINNTQKIR